MALARVKSWNAGDVLTAADLNAEFNNILNNALTLISPLTGNLNVNENQLLGLRLENLTAAPAAANIGRVWAQTAAGDVGVDLGSSQQGSVTFPISKSYQAQCRLQYVTSSQLQLIPYQGNKIPLKTGNAWELWNIPSTGINLSSTVFSNLSSMNYIYCFNSAGTPTLVGQTSSFSHAASTETGVETMTTDATRTLVGMCQTSTLSASFFSTLGVNNMVASWFNPKVASSQAAFTANRTVATSSYSEINSEIRQNFIVWSTDTATIKVTGAWALSSATNAGFCAVAFDGATPEDCQTAQQTAAVTMPLALGFEKVGLTEGPHFATLVGSATIITQTVTFKGGAAPTQAAPTQRCTLNVAVRV